MWDALIVHLFAGPAKRVESEPIVGAPAVHRQLVGWADELGVGPASGATVPSEVEVGAERPRAIGAIATFQELGGIASWSARAA
jgi:hypothetical protein